jgi:hypothetical protein
MHVQNVTPHPVVKMLIKKAKSFLTVEYGTGDLNALVKPKHELTLIDTCRICYNSNCITRIEC